MAFISPSRPELALRVGVTGARDLDPSRIARLEGQAKRWLGFVSAEMARLSALPEIAAAYGASAAQPLLRFTSPLALGADRLAAHAALDLGWSLYAVLPFVREEYERDWQDAAQVDEFRALLTQTAPDGVLELAGRRGRLEAQSYGAVGRAVVSRSDIMIAMWDGQPSNRRGGTWDTIRFAVRQGVPVIWLDITGEREPRWLHSRRDMLRPDTASDDLETALRAHLTSLVTPPEPWHRHAHGYFDKIVFFAAPKQVSPEQVYWSETEKHDRWIGWFTGMYGFFIALWARGWQRRLPESVTERTSQASAAITDSAGQYWQRRLLAPDKLSVAYAQRDRSTYVWVFVLAAFALIVGLGAVAPATIHATCATTASHGEATASGGHGTPHLSPAKPSADNAHAATPSADPKASEKAEGTCANQELMHFFHSLAVKLAWLELAILVMIFVLVVAVKRRQWHEKAIEYRLLAELYRKQGMLAPLGWTLPVPEVETVAGTHGRHKAERSSWVAWHFAADQRAAPFPSGHIDVALQRSQVLAVVSGQIYYHARRECQSELAGRRLEGAGAAAFFLVIVAVAAKLGLGRFDLHRTATGAGWLALLFPSVSAALVGIRAYAELELLAAQSSHMLVRLEEAERRIEAIAPDEDRAAEDLGAEALAVAMAMLQDLEGWARLFRLKVAEVG